MSSDQDISWRNLFRTHILDVAEGLDDKSISAKAAVKQLRRLANSDVEQMDEADIEVDFDVSGNILAGLISVGGAKAEHSDDPVEAALTKVHKIRDRNNGLRIIADTPGQDDLDSYNAAIESLRLALNAAHSDKKD